LPLVHEPLHHAPQPYKFGYDVKDHHGQQYREETGNGAGGVKGSYGFTDARGVKRQVDYVADHAGFRAQVKTNEPGTANQDPAAVKMISDAPYQGGVAHNGLGYGLGYGVGHVGVGHLGLGHGNLGLGYGLGNPAYGGYGLGYGLGGLGYARYGY